MVNFKIIHFSHAVNTQAPPEALILLSAVLEKNLALTTTAYCGNLPFPKTLEYPDAPTSITGTLDLSDANSFLLSSLIRLQILSILTEGLNVVF
jgi:hypothetical protein